MNYDDFDLISDRVKTIIGEENHVLGTFVDEIVAAMRTQKVRGVPVHDLACALYELSLATMLRIAPLEDAEAFARYVREGGESMRQSISQNWPPPDRNE